MYGSKHHADRYSDSASLFSVAERAMEIDLSQRVEWIALEMKEVDKDKHRTGMLSLVSGSPSAYAISTMLRPQKTVAHALELSKRSPSKV